MILLLLGVGYLNPRFLEVNGFLAFLRRAAPLMILTAGQLFVLVSGGFDLSVGSIVTLVVIGGALMIDNDPANTWWVILVLLGHGCRDRSRERFHRSLPESAIADCYAGHVAGFAWCGIVLVWRRTSRLPD